MADRSVSYKRTKEEQEAQPELDSNFVHLPKYDMKIQKIIADLQRKPLRLSRSGIPMSKAGRGIKVRIVPDVAKKIKRNFWK